MGPLRHQGCDLRIGCSRIKTAPTMEGLGLVDSREVCVKPRPGLGCDAGVRKRTQALVEHALSPRLSQARGEAMHRPHRSLLDPECGATFPLR